MGFERNMRIEYTNTADLRRENREGLVRKKNKMERGTN